MPERISSICFLIGIAMITGAVVAGLAYGIAVKSPALVVMAIGVALLYRKEYQHIPQVWRKIWK